MNRRFFAVAASLFLPALLIAQNPAAPAAGGQGPGGPPRGRGGPALPANIPAPRDDNRHKSFVEIAQHGNIDLLFVGDSITDWFSNAPRATGLAVWDANFGPFKPANFGIAGDTTQGVLWRMQNG